MNCIKRTFSLRIIILFFLATNLFFAEADAQELKIKVPGENKMSGYLMVYFKDDTHGIHMAVSDDGYAFTDINKGKPVIAGDSIAEQKGIRDPYIYRGQDGIFYMVMTDLHIFAKDAGYRQTKWDRNEKDFGWGNNRGFVVLKSADLKVWRHQSIRIDQSFPELSQIGCAWAPEIIFDEKLKQPMVYFTMRFGNGKNQIYYSYFDKDFTRITKKPELLFNYSKDVSYIDADITKIGKKYHMFYVPHDGTPGIKQAISKNINSGYVLDSNWVDDERGACEAPNLYKLIGQKKWILAYDIYGINPHNFGFVETSDFKKFTPLGKFNQGAMKATNFSSPKHPSIIQITAKELETLRGLFN
ncbi:beta-xylosidase [Pedobacter ginsenosidimutans]|uniref:Beta-xylosidase n=1 Tax=Pedobacter ginsenosidimutans TaxID=687842 RepID=A0A0T5VVJ4_9SPHI|nr:glycoside hydrolase family 43 protein [Pedobacter ginsenosidimutans]KRT17837.1 beta-xylosidase [Pedobacter ginsenosidimutans]